MSSKQERTRIEIISKFVENPNRSFLAIAKDVQTSRKTVQRVISNYKKGHNTTRQPGSGCPKGPRDKKLAAQVQRKFAGNPNTSEREMAVKVGTSRAQVRRIKEHYNLRSYKVQKVPDRSEDQQQRAKTRARKLYTQYLTKFDCVIMDDETYCRADFNQLPGDEYYTAKIKDGVSSKYTSRKIGKFPEKYLVWQAICSCGMRSEEFMMKGNMNSDMYIS